MDTTGLVEQLTPEQVDSERSESLDSERNRNLKLLNRTARKEAYRAMRKMQAVLNQARRKPKKTRKWKHPDSQYGRKLAVAMQRIVNSRRLTASEAATED